MFDGAHQICGSIVVKLLRQLRIECQLIIRRSETLKDGRAPSLSAPILGGETLWITRMLTQGVSARSTHGGKHINRGLNKQQVDTNRAPPPLYYYNACL